MDLRFTPEELAFRDELREWLGANHPGREPAGGKAELARLVAHDRHRDGRAFALGADHHALHRTLFLRTYFPAKGRGA